MKRLLIFMALILVAAGCSKDDASTPKTPSDTWDGTIATSFAGGVVYAEGTNAYTISTPAQLAYLADLVSTHSCNMSGKTFTLTANLNLNDKDWTPIGIYGNERYFKGTFDGGGFTISGLYINNSDAYIYVGLFGYVYGATIKNLSVAGSVTSSEADTYVGGVVGRDSEGSTITNCYSSVNVTGSSGSFACIGGVLGDGTDTFITNCYSSGSVTGGENAKVGGILGYIASSTTYPRITNCYSSGSITGGDSANVGGIVGHGEDAYITNCYSSGSISVNSGSDFGGILGAAPSGSGSEPTITNCYWNSAVTNCVGSGNIKDSSSGYEAKSSTDMQASSFLTLLNSNAVTYNSGSVPAQACAWVSGTENYPTLDFDTIAGN